MHTYVLKHNGIYINTYSLEKLHGAFRVHHCLCSITLSLSQSQRKICTPSHIYNVLFNFNIKMKENKEKPPQNPNILIAPNLPRTQKDPIQFPPSPKPEFRGAPSTDAPPTPGPESWDVAQPVTQEVRPTPMPTFCALTIKGARKAPGCLSLRVCACVQAQWVFLCVCVCVPVYVPVGSTALRPVAVCL